MTHTPPWAASGAFANLPNGRLWYRLQGPKEAPLLVLVHGLTTPSFVWDDMMPDLLAIGYQVLIYDHYGRGASDRPDVEHTFEFFDDALVGLLDHLGIDQPFDMLGYSMGGGIVTHFAARWPERVNRLMLLAPIGFRTELGGLFGWMARSGRAGDVVMRAIGGALFRIGARRTRRSESASPEIIAKQVAETRRSGFHHAVLSSIRHVTSRTLEAEHRKLAELGVPVLAIFGAEDGIIPVEGAEMVETLNAKATVHRVPGAGHCLAYTHADAVCGHIRTFIAV